MRIDQIDRQILDVLATDARISMASLAELTHLSRAAVHSRFTRLKATGVISQFTVRVNPELAGVHASAYVTLTVVQRQIQSVRERLCAMPAVEYCAQVSGHCDLLVLVRAPTVGSLGRDVIDRIHAIPGVQGTRILMVFDEWVRVPEAHPPEPA